MKFNWSAITKKYIGSPYKLGGWNPREGLDCLSFMVLLLNDLGIDLDRSRSYKGININNYTAVDKDKHSELLMDFVRHITKPISVKEAKIGDILVYENSEGKEFIGFLDGSSKMIICSVDKGVMLTSLSSRRCVEVRTWAIQQP